MKKIIFSLYAIVVCLGLFAQAPPQGINYQAMVYVPYGNQQVGVNSGGQIPANTKEVVVKFTLEEGNNGPVIYEEIHTDTTDQYGLLNKVIGTGTPTSNSPGLFNQIDWSLGDPYLRVSITLTDFNSTVTSYQKLWSVPYALYAGHANTADFATNSAHADSTDYADMAGNGITGVTDNGNGTLTFNYVDGSSYTTGVLSGLVGTAGPQGPAGQNGTNGLSAYDLWLAQGNTGTEADFLNSLQGPTGAQGPIGLTGLQGATGPAGPQGTPGSQDAWSLTGNSGTNPVNNFIGTTDAQDFLVKTSGVEQIRVLNNGMVGIGTNNPESRLHIKTTIPQRALTIESNFSPLIMKSLTDGCYTSYFTPGHLNSSQRAGWSGYGNGSTSDFSISNETPTGALFFRTDSTIRMTINSSGNVGIGTSIPTAKLHIVGGGVRLNSGLTNTSSRPPLSTTINPFEIRGSSGSSDVLNDGFLRLSAGGGTNTSSLSAIEISGYSTLSEMDKNIRFLTAGNERMRIDLTGKIGIGTSSPLGKLHVNNDVVGSDSSFVVTTAGKVGIGTDSPVATLSVVSDLRPMTLKSLSDGCYMELFTPGHNSANTRGAWFGFGNSTTTHLSLSNVSPTGSIYFSTNSFIRMTVNNSGNVGIGTINPTAKLHVNNDISGSDSSFVVTTAGKVGIGISSPNFKFQIEDASGGLFFDNQNIVFNRIKSSAGNAGFGKDILINSGGNGGLSPDIYIKTNGDGASNSGNVGIGTSTPARTLHVKSVMRLEPIATAPTTPAAGDMYFDSTINKLRVFDGTVWQNCW